jgi:hypothetical protein
VTWLGPIELGPGWKQRARVNKTQLGENWALSPAQMLEPHAANGWTREIEKAAGIAALRPAGLKI